MTTPDESTDHITTTRRRPSRPIVVLTAVTASALVVVGLLVFQPWRLFLDSVVDEAAPVAAASFSAAPVPSASDGRPPSASPSQPETRVLARGSFISHEHATSGQAVLLRLVDGSTVLRIEGLDTSNGPDLHVWLTDQAVVDGPSGWTVFDDGRYVDLGSLKGNKGSQNYVLPADAVIDGLGSVSIWCARFKVSFGAAALST